jgi:hypothetical protein
VDSVKSAKADFLFTTGPQFYLPGRRIDIFILGIHPLDFLLWGIHRLGQYPKQIALHLFKVVDDSSQCPT